MIVTIERDPDDGQILAAYLKVSDHQIHKTVELEEGECFVDVDISGNLVGIELLCPGNLQQMIERVDKDYPTPGVKEALGGLRVAVAA